MEVRELGELRLPAVGVGASKFGGQLDGAAVRAIVDAAIDSDATSSTPPTCTGERRERLLGEAVRGRRDGVVLATKFGMEWGGGDGAPGSRASIRHAVEGSLTRLGPTASTYTSTTCPTA
jgi:aryl-alcohol dehydrogenase-like predicted oxidoreductase